MNKAEAVKILKIMLTVLTDEYANETHSGRARYLEKKVYALNDAIAALRTLDLDRSTPAVSVDDLFSIEHIREAWKNYEDWTAKKSCLACANSPDGGVTCPYGPYCGKWFGHWTRVAFPVFLYHYMRVKRMEEGAE